MDKTRILAGLKATLSNPLTSEQGKREAREEMERIEQNPDQKILEPGQKTIPTGKPGEGRSLPAEQQSQNRSLGSYKATISNPRTGPEAKEQALHEIEQIGSQADVEHAHKDMDAPLPERQSGEAAVAEANNRAIGAAKGTLHKSNVSEEAKERARDKLRDMGIDPSTVE